MKCLCKFSINTHASAVAYSSAITYIVVNWQKNIIQHNKLIHLENSMLMYGIYNAETLEKLINTVHNIHNTTSLHERPFAGQQSSLTLRSLYYFIRSTPLLHKFTVIFKNSARQINCTIQGINNPAVHICISNKNFSERISTNFFGNSFKIERNSQ